MDMEKVREINQTYREKALREDYESDRTVDILVASRAVIHWEGLIGTDADTYTWGEVTKRFERHMRELETLLGN